MADKAAAGKQFLKLFVKPAAVVSGKKFLELSVKPAAACSEHASIKLLQEELANHLPSHRPHQLGRYRF